MPSFFKWDQPSRAEERAARDRQIEADEREAYRAVDQRDHRCCRICGKPCTNLGMLTALHHHHLIYRSKGGGHDSSNILSCCGSCHQAIHRSEIRVEGDADQRDPITRKLNGVAVYVRKESGFVIERWI